MDDLAPPPPTIRGVSPPIPLESQRGVWTTTPSSRCNMRAFRKTRTTAVVPRSRRRARRRGHDAMR